MKKHNKIRFSSIFSLLAISAAVTGFNILVSAQQEGLKNLPSKYKLKDGFSSQVSKEKFLSQLEGFERLSPEMPGYLDNENLFFFEIDYVKGGSKKIGGPEKEEGVSLFHEILPASNALGVRAVFLRRDYEANSQESGTEDSDLYENSFAKALAKKEHDKLQDYAYDTLHVMALPESRLPWDLRGELNGILNSQETLQQFLSDNLNSGVQRRQKLLAGFKKSTWLTNHKVLKGPFWNEKGFFQKPEEEWGAGAKAPQEAVFYKAPVTFLDLAPLSKYESIYLLFYADDSGDWKLMGGPDADGDRDDIVGVFKVKASDFSQTLGSRKAISIQNSDKNLDVVFVLESTNSLPLGPFDFHWTQDQLKGSTAFLDFLNHKLILGKEDIANMLGEYLSFPARAFQRKHIFVVGKALNKATDPTIQALALRILFEKGIYTGTESYQPAKDFLDSKTGQESRVEVKSLAEKVTERYLTFPIKLR